ncbi:hypothetical protein CALVIDRAFT_371672 [Calocera viscosa TUFC12733]|uniref:Uncharacterized protein n=1 Tax=Calocera viscosa (strain TUFC12733) TaxID=1330018 RepID=A0A167GWH7_CALVF|nr:hypothetical protein CALVIDRAFT_371672 [Calocera viscosa TUFC12733]
MCACIDISSVLRTKDPENGCQVDLLRRLNTSMKSPLRTGDKALPATICNLQFYAAHLLSSIAVSPNSRTVPVCRTLGRKNPGRARLNSADDVPFDARVREPSCLTGHTPPAMRLIDRLLGVCHLDLANCDGEDQDACRENRDLGGEGASEFLELFCARTGQARNDLSTLHDRRLHLMHFVSNRMSERNWDEGAEVKDGLGSRVRAACTLSLFPSADVRRDFPYDRPKCPAIRAGHAHRPLRARLPGRT